MEAFEYPGEVVLYEVNDEDVIFAEPDAESKCVEYCRLEGMSQQDISYTLRTGCTLYLAHLEKEGGAYYRDRSGNCVCLKFSDDDFYGEMYIYEDFRCDEPWVLEYAGRIGGAKSLQELFEALKELEQEDLETIHAVENIVDFTNLPAFGEQPANTVGIWSWDDAAKIVGTCLSDMRMEERDDR